MNTRTKQKSLLPKWVKGTFVMISVPAGTGDISSIWYRTLCGEICFQHIWNGYYIILVKQVYHSAQAEYHIA